MSNLNIKVQLFGTGKKRKMILKSYLVIIDCLLSILNILNNFYMLIILIKFNNYKLLNKIIYYFYNDWNTQIFINI